MCAPCKDVHEDIADVLKLNWPSYTFILHQMCSVEIIYAH